MSLINKIGGVAVGVLNSVTNKISCKNTISGINSVFKTATPLILNGVVKDVIHAATIDVDMSDIDELIRIKRTIATLNELDNREPNVAIAPFEIVSLVNSISNEINKLLNEFGEDKVFVDEFLIHYFIRQFNVPKMYVNKIFDILCNNYCIENKSIRDAYNLFYNAEEFETCGAQILKEKDVNVDAIEKIYRQKMKEQSQDCSKKVKQFVR